MSVSTLSGRRRQVAIVGAGPVGCLAALAMAKLGCDVDLYEGRPDIRLASSKASAQRRSVNLAISSRGLSAMSFVDPEMTTRIMKAAIPMKGRILHSANKAPELQEYDTQHGQAINSIDRGLLNESLLEEAQKHPRIQIHFEHKLTTASFDDKRLVFDIPQGRETLSIEKRFDLCIGADGSFSNVRQQMMRVVPMNFQQEYIPHGYVELRIPPRRDDPNREPEFALDPNGLHIWPRHAFMLIALPNQDRSFTSTLFAPREELERLRDPATILAWFNLHFPDTVELIGKDALVRDLTKNPRSPLISIKANPYHYKDCAVIIGDAAHSMVPFYGQGLNCGLEDVRVLVSMLLDGTPTSTGAPSSLGTEVFGLSSSSRSIARSLNEYSAKRHNDLLAICDLAMNNYTEMRHSVTTLTYKAHRFLDSLLMRLSGSSSLPRTSLPVLGDYATSGSHGWLATASRLNSSMSRSSSSPNAADWLPLYAMVTFRPDIPYGEAKRKSEQQEVLLRRTTSLSVLAGTGMLTVVALHRFGLFSSRSVR